MIFGICNKNVINFLVKLLDFSERICYNINIKATPYYKGNSR